jgi:hypothetical protein
MMWIKKRKLFLNEAKIRDVLLPKQAKEVSSVWGEKWLDHEEVYPTENIEQGKWKLSDEDKIKVLNAFFETDMSKIFELFEKLSDKFNEVIKQSIDINLVSKSNGGKEKWEIILKDLNIKKPKIDLIIYIYDSIFKNLSVAETKASEVVSRDENGRPIKNEKDEIVKVQKEVGSPIFSNNLTNIVGFIESYNRCYADDQIDVSDFRSNNYISNLISLAKQDHNTDYQTSYEIFDRDVYLSITHSPKDILNMSISRFFSSCQHLYTGGYRSRLLGNIFDPNSIPAFLIFESPIFWGKEKISDHLPLSRIIIRNIETFDENSKVKIFFDKSYPDRMKNIFWEVIEKYTKNKQDREGVTEYLWSPDIDLGEEGNLHEPYMDTIGVRKSITIGANTKNIYLNSVRDWSKVKISPRLNLDSIVIETDKIPEDLFKVNLKAKWIKFKFLTLNDLSKFSKINTESLAFDKCKINPEMIKDIKNLKKLRFSNCDISSLNIKSLTDLEELQIIFSLDSGSNLKDIIGDLKIKDLTVSTDVLSNPENKEFIKLLKSKKVSIKIIGPKL